MKSLLRSSPVLVVLVGAALWAGCPTDPASESETADAAVTAADAAVAEEDAGAGDADAAVADLDAGTQELDAAAADLDAAAPEVDAAVPPPDAGAAVPDAATAIDAAVAAPDAGPWAGVENLRDNALITALHDLVKNPHHSVGYDGAKVEMFGSNGLDVHGGKVECVYTAQLFNPGQLDTNGGFNVEHSWPQSEFGGESTTAKGDMHHLFPTERNINSCRSSYPFGETDSPASNCSRGGSQRGPRAGGRDLIFEVRSAKRGDIARAHFYFAVRYALHISAQEEAVLRAWHTQDPVDDAERARNDAIETRQHNRNPFVDRPEFVSAIQDF